MRDPDKSVDDLAHAVIGAAIEVHRVLGPRHQETVYERALAIELACRDIPFQAQAAIRVVYKGEVVGEGRIDLLVGGQLIVELKAVEQLLPIHAAQTLSYLRATGLQLALLINFNGTTLKNGIKRIANTQSTNQNRTNPANP